jgi:hypothetical protein
MLIQTAHAIEQYRNRLDPGASHKDAEALLRDELPRADRLKQKTPKGDALWRLPCGAYLISKRDGANDIVVTVLATLNGNGRGRGRRIMSTDMMLPEDEGDER